MKSRVHALACSLPGVAAVAVALCSPSPLPAQLQWRDVGPSPTLGSSWSAAYDQARDRIVALGFTGQTWEYDGSAWVQVFPGQSPFGGAMAYDAARARTVIFNGLQETWEWDGSSWTRMATSSPSPRYGPPSMVYHAGRRRVMLFGGWDFNWAPQNDLWEWDGVTWQQVPTPNAPPVSGGRNVDIFYTTLAYSYDRDVLTIFGATTVSGTIGNALAVTWEWDVANGWQQVQAGGPQLGSRLLTYDLARRSLVGVGADSGRLSVQVWERLGTANWTSRSIASPAPAFGIAYLLVYDDRRGRVVMPNSDGRTWVLEPTRPARYDSHGAGCAGSLGVPGLVPQQPWSLPWLGDTLDVSLLRLPLSAAVLATGFDDQRLGSMPLPIALGAFGLPGCSLRIAPEAAALVQGSGGTATFSLAVPNAARLLGLPFYQQALVLDPGANAFGAVVSDSAAGIIGGR